MCIVLATVSGVDGFDLCVAAGFLMDHLLQPTHTQWSAADIDTVYTVIRAVSSASVQESFRSLRGLDVCCVFVI